MSNECNCTKHENHDHQHGKGCGHTAIKHNDHVDYLHDGHLHHVHGNHVDEHTLEVNDTNPACCRPAKACGCAPECPCTACGTDECSCDCHAGQKACGCSANCSCTACGTDKCRCECSISACADGHIHGEGCGHEAVPHGDHVCYIVNGRLHFPHGDHCDDHGPVEIVK